MTAIQNGARVNPNPKPVMKRRILELSRQPKSWVKPSNAIIETQNVKDLMSSSQLRKHKKGEKIQPVKIPVHLAQIWNCLPLTKKERSCF